MRIAVYYNIPFGGAKRVVQEHVRGLRALGHKVDVYTQDASHDIFDPGSVANNEYRYIYKPHKISIPFLSRIAHDFQTLTLLKRLHKKIAQDIDARAYDIALIHTDILIQSPYILRFLKTNNAYFCLEPLRMAYEYSLRVEENLSPVNRLYEHLNRWIRKSIDRTNARAAKHTLALSYFGREYMIHAYNLYPRVSYLGVDEKIFKPKRVKKKNYVLFVAEPEYIYGYDLAKAAMELIPEDKRPELKIVFGTKKSQRITEDALIKLYNESLVTLSLSRFDTFGLVPLESMACGVPVIALRVAGYRETMKDGETGYLTEFNPQDIADKIICFLDDEHLSEKMGVKGRKWIEEKWTWKKQVKNLERLLINFSKE